MLTWVIVKARVDSSLNLYEHCVACDNENNCCPAVPALRGGQPCGATLRGRLPCLPCIRFALYTAILGVKTPRKRCTCFCLQRWPAAMRTAPWYQHKCAPKAKQALFAYFGRILAVLHKKARFLPILTHFEAIFGLHLANRAALGPKMESPFQADHLSCTFSVGDDPPVL